MSPEGWHEGTGGGSNLPGPFAEVFECVAPAGYIALSGDCDDDDDESYPGAEGFSEACLEMKTSRCSTMPANTMLGWVWSVGLAALLRRRRKEDE
jgi:hypothetical protein